MPKIIQETDPSNLGEALKAPFACLKFGLFGLFFQPEQCFSLTTIQPEQCFSASFSQNSDQRTGPKTEELDTSPCGGCVEAN